MAPLYLPVFVFRLILFIRCPHFLAYAVSPHPISCSHRITSTLSRNVRERTSLILLSLAFASSDRSTCLSCPLRVYNAMRIQIPESCSHTFQRESSRPLLPTKSHNLDLQLERLGSLLFRFLL